MKRILTGLLTVVFVFAFASFVKADKPSDMGFSDNGYNDTARIFNGTGAMWAEAKGLPADYLGIYSNDKLIMKWNAEWDRGNDEDWANPPYRAWSSNEWNGMTEGGSGSVWHYKNIWVGPQVWDVTGTYTMDTHYLGGNYFYTLTLTQTNGAISGNLYDQYLPDNLTVFDATLNGTTLTFKVDYSNGSSQGVRTFTGTISETGISGTWNETGPEAGADSWSTSTGATLTEGPYWREGGYRIWGEFETIMDQGIDPNIGPGHIWYAHATPNGYGAY